MVSGLLTRHICYVHLFLNHNCFSADIFLVLCYTILYLIDIGQGRRNGFVIGGGGKKNCTQNFFELHFHIERIRFCTLVNM